MARKVKICHAQGAGPENNGGLGDQSTEIGWSDWTKYEYTTTKTHNKKKYTVKVNGWDEIIRCTNKDIVDKVVQDAKKIYESKLVGYKNVVNGADNRNTFYDELEKCKWSVDKYIQSGVKTNTDCSAFVYQLYCIEVESLRQFRKDIHNSAYNENLAEAFLNYGGGNFVLVKRTDGNNLSDPALAQVGDIYNFNDYYKIDDGSTKRISHAVLVVSTEGESAPVRTSTTPTNNTSNSAAQSGYASRTGSGFSNRVRNISAATNITNTENNKVPLLATVSDFYKDKVLDNGSNRMEEFKSLKETLSNSAGNMGMDIYLPKELFDTNILKGSQESKTITT